MDGKVRNRPSAFDKTYQERLRAALSILKQGHEDAYTEHGPFNSTHEGIAVIQEEVNELWQAIQRKDPPESLQREATQIGAMAVRFLIDFGPDDLFYR